MKLAIAILSAAVAVIADVLAPSHPVAGLIIGSLALTSTIAALAAGRSR